MVPLWRQIHLIIQLFTQRPFNKVCIQQCRKLSVRSSCWLHSLHILCLIFHLLSHCSSSPHRTDLKFERNHLMVPHQCFNILILVLSYYKYELETFNILLYGAFKDTPISISANIQCTHLKIHFMNTPICKHYSLHTVLCRDGDEIDTQK